MLDSDVDVQKLSDIQKQAIDFIKDKVPSIKDAKLIQGVQDDKKFKFQFVGQDAPIKITEVVADRISDDEKAKDVKFKLGEVLQSFSTPVNGGRLTSITKSYGIQSFDKALENLDWK